MNIITIEIKKHKIPSDLSLSYTYAEKINDPNAMMIDPIIPASANVLSIILG